jgi:hypothetical protein
MNSDAMTGPARNPVDTRGCVGNGCGVEEVRGTRFVAAQFRATAMQAALVTQLTETAALARHESREPFLK